MRVLRTIGVWLVLLPSLCVAQEAHNHKAPETLGEVSFRVTCAVAVQPEFDRGVALLHSFAYAVAEQAFQHVAEQNPKCAMAHWGIAMTHFHQLWDPPIAPDMISTAQAEVRRAKEIGTESTLERALITALGLIFEEVTTVPFRTRALNYEHAMSDIAVANKDVVEVQVFYALALLANASPADKTHAKQKQAVDLLDPLYRAYPQHPGIPHYLIHACDNAELANRGLPAARVYAKIAASAPHALHMPSHIFTRLGLWDDSIASNMAAKDAARQQGDTGEELHAMDYLVYAYLQSGREAEAAHVLQDLGNLKLHAVDFKTGYASTAMPVRYAVERRQWTDATNIVPPTTAPPHVIAIAVWASGMGLARSGRAAESQPEIDKLLQIEAQLHASGNEYWAAQVNIMAREITAWSAQAEKRPAEAVATMRDAADAEDALEKLPVTPGPILPAREQLGDMLLQQGQSNLALKEFETALVNAPGRRGALEGKARAARLAQKPLNT